MGMYGWDPAAEEGKDETALDRFCARLAKRGITPGTMAYTYAMEGWEAASEAVAEGEDVSA